MEAVKEDVLADILSLSDSREYKRVIELFDKSLGLLSNNWEAWCARSWCNYLLGEFNSSLEDLKKAEELKPNEAIIFSVRGLTKAALGYLEDALLDTNKAIELDPSHWVYYSNRGVVYSSLEKHEEAIQDFKKAIELKEENYYHNNRDVFESLILRDNDNQIHTNIGYNYLFLKKYSEAEYHFNRVLKLKDYNPEEEIQEIRKKEEYPKAIQGKGFILYFSHNQKEEAEKYFKQADYLSKTKFSSDIIIHVELYYYRAKIFYLHSEFTLSFQAIQKGLQIKPEYHQLLQLQTLQKLTQSQIPSLLSKNPLVNLFTDNILMIQPSELTYLKAGRYKIIAGKFGKGDDLDRVIFLGEFNKKQIAIRDFVMRSFKHNKQLVEQIENKILAEVKISSYLSSQYLVKTFGLCKQIDRWSIVMEYVDGGSLHDILYYAEAEEQLTWKDVFQISTDICKGVKFLHENGIIHGDLKSENILLTSDYHAKIADFASYKGKFTNAIGKIEINMLAPEILGNSGFIGTTKETDIYSLGLILSEIITREPPFHNEIMKIQCGQLSLEEFIKGICSGTIKPSFNPNTPPKLREVINKCITIKPTERMKITETTIQEIEDEAKGLPPYFGDSKVLSMYAV